MKQALNKKSVAILMSTIFNSSCILAASSLMNTAYAQTAEVGILTNIPITLKSEIESSSVFNIEGTNKLIIDFQSKVDNEASISELSTDNPLVNKIDVKKVGNRIRIIMDLKNPVKYNLGNKDKVYTLELKKSDKFESASPLLNKNETFKPTVEVSNVVEKTVKHGLTNEEKERIIAQVKASVNKEVVRPKVAEAIPVAPVIPVQTVATVEVQKINVKKTEDKSAKITIEFNDPAFTPTITKVEDNLIVDLKGVAIPPEFQKSINTKNLGTVLQNIDVATQKGSGRLVLSQKEGWTHSVYQTDKRLVIEVKNAQEKTVERTYKGKPLSLNFQNMDVRAVLQSIADFTTLNIMASDSIQGAMTIRLTNVPWDQALDLVLESRNLQKVQEGNVIWIATRQEIAEKNKSNLELLAQKAELAPLKLEFFQLNHYKAQDLKEVIEGKTASSSAIQNNSTPPKSFLSKRGSVGLDLRNNTLFVQDTEENINEVRKIIRRLDISIRQVAIEAKLVVATDKFGKDLGARFGIGGTKSSGNTTVGIGNAYNSSNQTYAIGANQGPYSTNGVANALSPNGLNAFNSPVTGGGALGFTILNALSGNYLSFELSALEQNNLGKVISTPRVLTADNKKATIRQGTQVPYTIPGTANSAPTVSFKDAVLKLEVTPQVSPNGRIVLNLDISKDTVGQMISLPGGGQVPSIETRSITTEVTIKDGQTVVLGGVYEVSSANDVSKVPFFGDIPFLGNLFKNTSKSNEKAELLIFITPHVINDEDLDSPPPELKEVEEINLQIENNKKETKK